MRSVVAIAAALLLFSVVGVTKAADPTLLAETGAYLLGNAYRCGVSPQRVKHAGQVIGDLITVAARDSTEAAAAHARFFEIFSASAIPSEDQNGFPACEIVIAQFKRLEQHHRQAGFN